MEISTRHRDNVAILDIRGDIIGDNRFDLNKKIQEQIDSEILMIILNLDEVPIMDSVALGVITAGLTQLIKKRGEISPAKCRGKSKISSGRNQTG